MQTQSIRCNIEGEEIMIFEDTGHYVWNFHASHDFSYYHYKVGLYYAGQRQNVKEEEE